MKKLMVLVAAMAMITSSAYAADWNFYGSARMTTFWTDVDFNVAGVEDNLNVNHSLQGNARIGARVKVSDELSARFEYGTGVNVRILYGEWDFGAGKMLVGQTYGPLNMFYSNQVYGSDNDLLNFGGVYGGRNPMIQFRFGDFKLAFLTPNTGSTTATGAVVPGPVPPWGTATPIVYTANEAVFPKIEASYRYNAEAFHVAIQGGYQTYEAANNFNTNKIDVSSWILALGGGVTFGQAYLNANVWWGQNPGAYGLYNSPVDDPTATVAGQINDNDGLGYLIVLGYTVNDMFNLEAGYAQAQAELDVAGATEDKDRSYYIQSTITMAPGVFIVPELGVIDYVESNTPKAVYYGLKWQINF